MTTSSPSHSRIRLLLGSATICLVLVAFSAFTSHTGGRSATKPGDGIPGQPEANPVAMDDYIQQLDFGAGADPAGIFEGNLACGMPAKCGGQDSVRLRIVPSNYATTADWDHALSNGNGYVVAKVANLEGVTYDRLNLGPHQIAFVWVGDSQGLGRTVALYAVKGGAVNRLIKFKGRTFCRYSTSQPPGVHINTPSKCTDTKSMPMGAASEQASIEPFTAIAALLTKTVARLLTPPPIDSGLWISCSLGCCEAQF